MKGKNRFSKLLSYLMEVVELKNYTLANELQYDVSYISKWVNGQMLPGSKTERNVLQGISRCIVKHGSPAGLEKLCAEYLVTSDGELEGAVFDHLMAEYYYVKNVQQENEHSIAPKTQYFPQLDLRQYIERMHHPVLRRVNSLDIMAMMDLMAMDREYRLQMVRMDNRAVDADYYYPNVRFSMIIDLNTIRNDHVYDVVFLLNMLTDMTHVDFRLYGSHRACGRAIFTVKDEFAISGMLMQSQTAMSVVVSEDSVASDTMYQFLEGLCTRERMLVRQSSMSDLIRNNDYVRSLIAPNQKLIFGHMTEHFLPDDLFETIIQEHPELENVEQIRWFQALSKRRFKELPIKLIFRGIALSEFTVEGTLEFYNHHLKLTPSQRKQYLCSIRDIIASNENLSVHFVNGKLFSDFQYQSNQCLFLNEGYSYLTLGNTGAHNLYVVNTPQMKQVFEQFFDAIWNGFTDVVVSDLDTVLRYFDHAIHQIDMILMLEESVKDMK